MGDIIRPAQCPCTLRRDHRHRTGPSVSIFCTGRSWCRPSVPTRRPSLAAVCACLARCRVSRSWPRNAVGRAASVSSIASHVFAPSEFSQSERQGAARSARDHTRLVLCDYGNLAASTFGSMTRAAACSTLRQISFQARAPSRARRGGCSFEGGGLGRKLSVYRYRRPTGPIA